MSVARIDQVAVRGFKAVDFVANAQGYAAFEHITDLKFTVDVRRSGYHMYKKNMHVPEMRV